MAKFGATDVSRSVILLSLLPWYTHPTPMAPPVISFDREVIAKIAFRVLGVGFLLLFLLWNPLVLRPRFWDMSFVLRSMLISTVLLSEAFGFIFLRRWAALLDAAVFVTVAVLAGFEGAVIGFALVPVALSLFFWRNLVRGDRVRDLIVVTSLVALDVLLHEVAYRLR